MVTLETTYNATLGLTPEFAAELSQTAAHFHSDIQLSCEGKQLSLDSLISILSLDLHRGVKVKVIAEGEDAQEAAKTIVSKIEGNEETASR